MSLRCYRNSRMGSVAKARECWGRAGWAQATAAFGVAETGKGEDLFTAQSEPGLFGCLSFPITYLSSFFFFFGLLYSLDTLTVCSLLDLGCSSKAAKVDKNLGQLVLYHLPKLGTNNPRAKNYTHWSESHPALGDFLAGKVLDKPAGAANLDLCSHQHQGLRLAGLSRVGGSFSLHGNLPPHHRHRPMSVLPKPCCVLNPGGVQMSFDQETEGNLSL